MQQKTLWEVCEIYQPKTISKKQMVVDGKYAVFGANGIIGQYSEYNHEEPELLITCRGATCGSVNISTPYSWINGNAMVVRPRESNLLRDYVKYFFLGGIDISEVISGSAQPQITRQSLAPVKIPIPPLPEQKRIVEVLDAAFAKIDRCEAITKQNITNAEELFEGTLNSYFNVNAVKLHDARLGDLLDVRDGTHDSPKYVENGFRFATQKNIRIDGFDLTNTKFISEADHIKFYKRSNVAKGDLLISMIGVNRGMVCVVDTDEVFSIKNVGLVKKNDTFNMHYILYYLKSPFAKRYVESESKGGAQPFIGLKKLRKFPLFDHSFERQKIIAANLEVLSKKLENSKSLHKQKLKALAELRQSLLQKAFAGELVADMTSAEILLFPMKPEGIEPQALQCALVAKTYEQISAGVNDNFFYGRTMAEKTSHMMEAYVGIDLGREAIQGRHGPTDDNARKAMEAYAKDNGYFTMQKIKIGKTAYKLMRGQGFDQATALADQYLEPFKDKFYKLIGVIKTMKTRELEVFTTVYAAWNNLLQDKANITDENIVLAARKKWHEDKEKIDRSQFVKAIKTLRQNNMVPTGIGKYVSPIGAQGQERFDL